MTLPARNLLGDETSPYLLQHKDNPVHWRPWSPDALAEAKTLGKPILLSSGYTACHWCHVMRHESFDDAETAALMNERFVCIKLDREERPEIDLLFQTSLQAMNLQGGWPLTAFLTPEGDFFAGGTYFPAEPNDGRPGFKAVLTNVLQALADTPEAMQNNVTQIRAALNRVWHDEQPKPVNPQFIDFAARRACQRIDVFSGGVDGQPKFPNTPTLHMLWRAYLRTGAQQFGNAIGVSLDNMCQGGIYDHLGGGFSRYSIDERWLVPHFEKMLYDNAGMIELLTLVWQHTRSPLYTTRVDETVDWVLREMVTKEGAFATSLDSDSDGEEGKFYTWSEAEIDDVLGPNEAPLFKQVYGVTTQGNWEGKNVLHRLGVMGFLRPDQEATLTRHRRMLQMARAKRAAPLTDDKVMPDVNGMMIAALASAGAVFKKAEWHFAAVRAFWVINERLGSEGNRLAQSWRGTPYRAEATADGYAEMARAAMVLYEFTSDERYLERATAWIERLESRFLDAARGGYYLSSADALDVPVRIKTSLDQAGPNYNGVIAEVLARLFYLTGETKYRDRSNLLVAAFGAEIERQLFASATLMNALEFIMSVVQVVIIGDERSPDTQALVRAVLERSVPVRILTILRPGQKLHKEHPAYGKSMEGGQPTAYAFSGQTCSPPITNAAQLANGLLSPPFAAMAQAQAEQQQQMMAANNR